MPDGGIEEAHAQQPATGFRTLQTFREENRPDAVLNKEVSVDPNSVFRDPAVTMQTPRTKNRSVPSGPPSAAVTEGLVRSKKEQKNIEVVHLSTLKSVPSVASILWGGPTTRSSAS